MSNLVVNVSEIATATTSFLRDELARGLTLTADTLTRLGAIWAELERRGEDLSDLRAGLARTLPLIASGRLAAEAVVAFAGRPLVLRCLEGVPVEEQRRLADGAPIPVYLPGEDAPQSLPVSRIPSAAITRVIADGMIRTPAEQRMAIKSRKKKPKERKHTVTADKDDRTIRIGHITVPITSVIAALVDAAGGSVEVTESGDRPARTIAAKVTDEEKERIESAAKALGVTVQDLVRKAVIAMWMV